MTTLELTALSFSFVMFATSLTWYAKPTISQPRPIGTIDNKTVEGIRAWAKENVSLPPPILVMFLNFLDAPQPSRDLAPDPTHFYPPTPLPNQRALELLHQTMPHGTLLASLAAHHCAAMGPVPIRYVAIPRRTVPPAGVAYLDRLQFCFHSRVELPLSNVHRAAAVENMQCLSYMLHNLCRTVLLGGNKGEEEDECEGAGGHTDQGR